LSAAVNGFKEPLQAVRENSDTSKIQIRKTFENLAALLREREDELVKEVEAAQRQKTKELEIQRDEIEFFLKEIRRCTGFARDLVKEGSETEIGGSHKQVVARLKTLDVEITDLNLNLITDPLIEFQGAEKGTQEMLEVVKRIGTVFTENISIGNSRFEATPGTFSVINQPCLFKVTLCDKNGNKVESKGRIPFNVKVSGPSNSTVTFLFLFFSFKIFFFCC
jgi:hypothetical protein